MTEADEMALALGTYGDTTGPVKDALDQAAEEYAASKRRPADLQRVIEAAIDRIRSVDWRTGGAKPEEPKDETRPLF